MAAVAAVAAVAARSSQSAVAVPLDRSGGIELDRKSSIYLKKFGS